ncbi:MAG TPA: Cna B-type domain-containing protein [Candidatus Faecousia faecavium]|nr:Cna B-type domain-containing protein [Candidatus Faecousia faecavium]
MKQRLKKGIAFVLVVLLLATCVPMRTFAEGNQVPQTQTVETEVETTSSQTDQTHTDQVPTETVQTPTADGAPTQGPEVKTGPVDGDASAAPAQNTPKTQTGETTLQTIQLDVAAVEVIDFGEGSAVVIKEPPQQVVTAAAENGKLTITAVEAGTVSFQVDVSGAAGNQQIQYTVTVLPQNDEQPEQEPLPPADLPAEKTENQEPDQSETITVTFRIDNPDYTRDAVSGNTHITVDEPYDQGRGLSYTQWVKTYKVTGRGVLASYKIPAGTALASWPKVNVTNIGNDNEVTYISSYAWVDGQGNVCSPNAAFAQDTVLSLYLYRDNTSYSLDFVCGGCDGKYHSIPYILGGYPSATFTLGQSVSQAYIPTAEDINANYSSEWCQHGKGHGEVFDKWQLKNSATGEMVDFAAGVPITQDYVENGDHSIKVYAQWLNEPVTATFKNGETVVEGRKVSKGSALGTLPAVTAPEGQVFQDWEYTDGKGNLQLATEETILTQDTVFTAKFVQSQICSVTFRDVQPQGDEAAAVTVQADSGCTLEQAIQASDQSVWADGTSLSQCKWYTLGQDGQKVPAELSDLVSGDMELYTYTYQVQLTLSPQQVAMALSMAEVQNHPDGSITLTITAREGQQLAASDFVIDGVDYSVYTWQTRDGAKVSIQNLIQNGLTENIIADSQDSQPETLSIQFFIAKDGKWIPLEERNMAVYLCSDRYALTAAQLESVYGAYGFRAGNLEVNKKLFGHTSRDNDKIWTNAPAVKQGGIVYVRILKRDDVNNKGQECDVYYLPNSFQGNDNDGDPKESLAALESFYSVEIQDPNHKVYEKDELPATTYTLKGRTATVTVKNGPGVVWECVGKDGTSVNGVSQGDTTVFTIESISQPYIISPALKEGEVRITYIMNLDPPPSDPEYGAPNIEGQQVFTWVQPSANPHSVRAPSQQSYFFESDKYLGMATFEGWLCDADNQVHQIGEYYKIPNGKTEITFTAKWETQTGHEADHNNNTLVNFFVSIGAVPEGSTRWESGLNSDVFTSSVFVSDCGVSGNDAMRPGVGIQKNPNNPDQYYILGQSTGNDLNAIHSEIYNKLTNGYEKTADNGTTFTFQVDFPNDEEVLQNIRSMVADGTGHIQLNGKDVAADDLTDTKFTIKWHVFKYDATDGWHIDGVLVAKTGNMRITKTFAGNPDAIEAAKNGFYVDVTTDTSDGSESPHGNRVLRLTDEGVKKSDDGSTYTWDIPVDQYRDYTVAEMEYEYTQNGIKTTAEYQVKNSRQADQNTAGWRSGDSALVTGQASQINEVQTVSFLNTYTQPGVMTLKKIDALTGQTMPNISFTVLDEHGTPVTLYFGGPGRYSIDPADGSLVPDSKAVTDGSGQIYLKLEHSTTYIFQEDVPVGYENPGKITVTLDADGKQIIDARAENGDKFVSKSEMELTVKNYSPVLPLTVEKQWLDRENTPVSVSVYYDGQPLLNGFTAELEERNAWRHTFTTRVPLYIDGKRAEYTIREDKIGDWNYSSTEPDGYRFYDVKTLPMEYRDASGQKTENPSDAVGIYLTVTNERDTGTLRFRKVDQNGQGLSQVFFYLYTIPANATKVPTVTEGTGEHAGHNVIEGFGDPFTAVSNPDVVFNNLQGGQYYMVEHYTPAGYTLKDDLYRVTVSGNTITMEKQSGSGWTTLSADADSKMIEIENVREFVDVTVTKKVTGNMAIFSEPFSFTAASKLYKPIQIVKDNGTLEEYNGGFTLRNGQSITLRVQKGDEITLTETGAADYTTSITIDGNSSVDNGKTVTVSIDNTEMEADKSVVFTNHKDMDIDTGVILDTLPYILILAVVVIGGVVLLKSRKRRRED